MKRLIVILGLLGALSGCYTDTSSILTGLGVGVSQVLQNYTFEHLTKDQDEDKKK